MTTEIYYIECRPHDSLVTFSADVQFPEYLHIRPQVGEYLLLIEGQRRNIGFIIKNIAYRFDGECTTLILYLEDLYIQEH